MRRQESGFRPRLECLEDRAVPATFTVNTTLDTVTPGDGKLSLREAITRANNRAGADTILLPAGAFKVTRAGAGEDGNSTGDFDITDTVAILGHGAGLTIVDGQKQDRLFHVLGSGPGSIRCVLQGLTVRNGSATDGGGILTGGADLVLRDAAVKNNRASSSGGGISNEAAPASGMVKLVRTSIAANAADGPGGGLFVVGADTLSIAGGTVKRNSSTSHGGGLFVSDNATLKNCTISGNTATGAGGGILADALTASGCTISGNSAASASGGGGLYVITAARLTNTTVKDNEAAGEGGGLRAETATLTNSRVNGNTATLGGGIHAASVNSTNSRINGNSGSSGGGVWATTATLSNSTLAENFALADGGGINAANLNLSRCTVSGNTANGAGGGINAAMVVATNCTIAGNTSGDSGGGIAADSGTLLHCTIARNTAALGGGVHKRSSVAALFLRNSIIALNTVPQNGTGPDLAGVFESLGHNLIGIGAGASANEAAGDIIGRIASPINPRLGPLQYNGGPNMTMALLAGSRAIDAGDNAGAPATDQRGLARKKDGNFNGVAIVDIGAFER